MAKRNIGQEIVDSLREIKTGGGRRYRFTAPEEIRRIRDGVGVSQANFARMLGISLRTLQDWEQGRRRPNQAAQS
jgi:putative transcriptional regulator